MIIIKSKGGLGNQFFQYAFGRSLSSRLNTELGLDIDSPNRFGLKRDIAREYKLDNFNIKARKATPQEIAKVKKPWKIFYAKLIRKITNYNYHTFRPRLLNVRDNTYFEGLWFQTEKYFKNIEMDIFHELSLKDEFKGHALEAQHNIERIKSEGKQAVIIHVRRGDYITDPQTQKHHGVCGIEYYQKAISLMNEKLAGEKLVFFLVSDDIDWVKENIVPLLGAKEIFVLSHPEIKDYEEIILMSHCQHFIIANSSFSWWGAWLGEKRNGDKKSIIIAPHQWTKNSSFPDSPVPERWVRIMA